MCILPSTTDPVAPVADAPTCPAQRLTPAQSRQLALAALGGARPVAHLATEHQVSRKFVYQQADKAEQALTAAFAPEFPADDRVLLWLPVTAPWLRRLILALLLVCHSSYRGVHELLRDLFHYPLSLGTIHNVARAMAARARDLNGRHDLSAVGVGAHDELFQGRRPVLVGVDVASTYCYLLSLEEERDGDTWAVRLLELRDRGFAPQAVISDAGTGLQAGHALALPDVPRRGDVFHVLHEVGPLVPFLENRAYQALRACAKRQRRQADNERRHGRRDPSVSQQLRHAVPAADAAVALADDVATLVDWLRRDILALAGPCHAERLALYDFVLAELRARVAQCPHRLGPVCTYLANQRAAVLAFAQHLDANVAAVAADFQVPVAVARAVLAVQELDMRDRRRWPQEAALRQQLRGRFHALAEAVAAVARGTVRASSVVENLNSRLRNYFFLRRHLGSGYLQLLQFFLNHRRFLRSEHPERVYQSPAELLTGHAHAHWLELLGLPDPLRN
jgi:hypothetical protein